MRLVVTGGAGFIGSNFVRHWMRGHPDDSIVVLDALTYAGNPANLEGIEGDVRLVEGDIGDLERCLEVLGEAPVDHVVNFAAESHNSYALLEPARFVRTNVLGTQTLLEAARQVGVGRFHHVSTCEVYGDLPLDAGPEAAFHEESPYRPRAPYNASKAAGDHLVRAYFHTWDLPVTITNCANNYGPYQFPEKVIPRFVALAMEDKPLEMYASTGHRREWIHVRDHCMGIEAVLEGGRVGETYHIGTGFEASIEEVADAVLDALGKPRSLKTTVPDRPGHERRYLLDSSKIRRELGWEPQLSWERSLPETVRWYAGNRAWWEPLVGRAPVVETAWGA